MGRSEPGGEKKRELPRMATMVIAAGRREGRQANDWRTFNEKRIKQAKTGLFIQNLCETEHSGDYERSGIFILESRRDLGRLYEMAPVRIAVRSLMDTVYLGHTSYRSLSYNPIVIQKRGLIVTLSCFFALFKSYLRMYFTCKYLEMSSDIIHHM